MLIEQWIANKMREDTGLRTEVLECANLAETDPEQAARLLADSLLGSAGVAMENTYASDSIVTAMVRDACSLLEWGRITWYFHA